VAITLRVEVPKGAFSGYFLASERELATATKTAMAATGKDALAAGKSNIAAAGFSGKWQKAWQLQVYPKGNRPSLGATAFLVNKIPYSAVFEEGSKIRGKPLLWVPFSTTPIFAGADRKRLSIKAFSESVGRLYTLPYKTRRGYPILGAPMWYSSTDSGQQVTRNSLRLGASLHKNRKTKRERGIGERWKWQPLFFGIPQVNIKKRFDLVRVSEQAANGFPSRFAQAFASLKV